MDIKFIADIHISPLSIAELRDLGFDIQRMSDFLLPNADDEDIISLSLDKNAVIITQDLDFSDLIIQSGQPKPSVISIRLEKPYPKKVTKVLSALLPKIEKELLSGCIVSVDETRFRVRKLPVDLS